MDNRIQELLKESQEELQSLKEQLNKVTEQLLEETALINLKLELELIKLNNLKQ